MRQTIDPHVEFNWGPTLWAAATLVLTALVATVVLGWTGFPVAAAWLILVITIVLPLAYIGALLGDVTRKRIGGSLGY